jgi:hypothetical protein
MVITILDLGDKMATKAEKCHPDLLKSQGQEDML